MEKFTRITSDYQFFDLFDFKHVKCPLLIPDTILMKHRNHNMFILYF